MYFSVNCKILRKANDLTQAGLANLLGLQATSVSAWENGLSHPNANTLIELSNLFKVSIDDLLKKDLAGSSVSPAQAHSIYDKSQTYIKALEATIRLRCPELAKELGLI